jgi:LysR family glycine cleavage system transcriptional activator
MPKFRLPPLNSLRAFEAAARYQSFKTAAGELHVARAAVSRHVHKLELYVGRKLFNRHHRQIFLTDAGETLLAAVSTGFSHIHRAFMLLRGNQYSDRLVISVDPDFAALWLAPRLGEFYAVVPHTLLEIRAENTGLSSLNPEVSCAIQYGEVGAARKNVELLFRSRLFPVCSPELTRTAPLTTPADLRGRMLIFDRASEEWEEYLHTYAPNVEVNLREGILFNGTALCMDAAVRGQGVAMGDDCLAGRDLSEGRLVKPFKSFVLSRNAYYWVVPRGAPAHPSLKALRAWLVKSIRAAR